MKKVSRKVTIVKSIVKFTVLVVDYNSGVNDFPYVNLSKDKYKLLHAKTMTSAKNALKAYKQEIDFLFIPACLRDTRPDTIPFIWKLRADSDFHGKIIVISNQYKEMVGPEMAHFGCNVFKETFLEELRQSSIPVVIRFPKSNHKKITAVA